MSTIYPLEGMNARDILTLVYNLLVEELEGVTDVEGMMIRKRWEVLTSSRLSGIACLRCMPSNHRYPGNQHPAAELDSLFRQVHWYGFGVWREASGSSS